MTAKSERRPGSEPRRPRWLARLGRSASLWFSLLVLLLCGFTIWRLWLWRQAGLAGHGLEATYYARTDFKGPVFRRGVEPAILFSDESHPHFKRPAFSAVWRGTIVLPRAGRYLFVLESDDGSWLDLDGKPLISNPGIHERRRADAVRVLPAGAHAIELRYFQNGHGSTMRFTWTPPGRRGGPEYISQTLLFPKPPHEVDLARAHAIPPRDLPTVLGILGAILISALLLGRRTLAGYLAALAREREVRLDLVLFLGIGAGALALRLWNLSGAGQTWDEDVYWAAGRNFVRNLLDLNLAASNWRWNLEHPALAKWLYGPATFIAEGFEPARAVAAFVGALTCACAFLLARDLVGRRVGVLTGALAAVMPHLLAHSKVIGLEAPSGLFFTLGLLLFVRGLRSWDRPEAAGGNSGAFLWAGVVAGLAIATRVTNISVVLAMGGLYLAWHWETITRERRFPVSLSLGLAPLLCLVTFFGLWPFLWANPLQHLGEMLVHWKPDANQEYFLGELRDSPRYYFPLYFAVTMPAGVLAALLLGLGRVALRRDLGHLGLLLWWLCPFLVMFSPLARDGVRYLYPALIGGCALAAIGLDALAELLGRIVKRRAAAVVALAVLGTGTGLYTMSAALSVHPYYLDYYSELVGGPEQVERKRWFEIAWWGEGIGEAVRYLDRVAPQNARVFVFANPRHVITLRPDLQWADNDSADFILYNRLFNPPLHAPRHRIGYVVRAGGAPLCWVYERDVP